MLHFEQRSESDNPVTNRCEFRNDRPSLKWDKYLFPNLDPYLKCLYFFGLKMLLRFSLKITISFWDLRSLPKVDHNFEKKGKNDLEKFTDLCKNLEYTTPVLVLCKLTVKLGIQVLIRGRVKLRCILWNRDRPRNLARSDRSDQPSSLSSLTLDVKCKAPTVNLPALYCIWLSLYMSDCLRLLK